MSYANISEVCFALGSGQITPAEAAALIAGFAPPARQPSAITWKCSAKGGVQIAGLNSRFPVTLYLSQLERLAATLPAIIAWGKDSIAKGTQHVVEERDEKGVKTGNSAKRLLSASKA